jgi:Predicted lipoprotein of unknown function (DUF2380)
VAPGLADLPGHVVKGPEDGKGLPGRAICQQCSRGLAQAASPHSLFVHLDHILWPPLSWWGSIFTAKKVPEPVGDSALRLGGALPPPGAEGIALQVGQQVARGSSMNAHHLFPRAFGPIWSGLDIEIEEFRVQLSEGTHLGQLHSSAGIPGVGPGGLWNETWRQYFAAEEAAGRALTQEGVFEQLGQMLEDFDILWYTPIP